VMGLVTNEGKIGGDYYAPLFAIGLSLFLFWFPCCWRTFHAHRIRFVAVFGHLSARIYGNSRVQRARCNPNFFVFVLLADCVFVCERVGSLSSNRGFQCPS
jgi:hypothetical protein